MIHYNYQRARILLGLIPLLLFGILGPLDPVELQFVILWIPSIAATCLWRDRAARCLEYLIRRVRG